MNEIVFITGTSSGIGQALVRRRTTQDAVIGLVARRIDVLHEFVQTLPVGIQGRCHCYAADVRSAESMHDITNAFIATVGLPNMVIANADISVGTDLHESGGLKAFAVVMGANWVGMLNTFQPFVGSMLACAKPGQPSGTLVGIASVADMCGLPGTAAYSASKSAVIKLVENLHAEFDPLGLRVVTTAPGRIRTPMTEHNLYPMPFLMSVDRFALRAVNTIHRDMRFTVLSWPMGMVTKLLHVLPRGLYDFAFARIGCKPRNPEISS